MALPLDPGVGTVSYNGITFGPYTDTIGYDVAPIPSSDGRTAIANRYRIRLKTVIVNPSQSGSDDNMNTIMEALSAYGGRFIYTGKGGRPIDTGPSVGSDLMWGPRPQMVSWNPTGGNRTADLVWEVELALTDCSNVSPFGRVMEFSWEVVYEQQEHRLTRRDIRGMLRIPARKVSVNNKLVFDFADRYYDDVVPPLQLGFVRQNEHREMTPDKSTLKFSFTDQQVENPRPPGTVSDPEIEIATSNTLPYLFTNWNTNINATYHMAQHMPQSWSLVYFLDLVKDRMVATIKELGAAAKNILPISFSIRERPQTRSTSYQFAYSLLCKLPLVITPGTWRPLPWHNHQLWAQSMAFANKPRGYTNEIFRPGYDSIVDLCTNPGSPQVPLAQLPIENQASQFLQALNVTCPSPGNSWIQYEIALVVMVEDGIVQHQPLPTKPTPPKPYTPGGPGFVPPSDAVGYTPPPASATGATNDAATKLQRRHQPRFEFFLIGRAARACYPVAPPSLVSVAGIPVIEANRVGSEYFVTQIVGQMGIPVFVAQWSRRFLLNGRYPMQTVEPPLAPTTPRTDTGKLKLGRNR